MAGKLKPKFEKKPYAPGSQEAIEIGCVCPVEKNNKGAGAYRNKSGFPVFWFDKGCPIHGGADAIALDALLYEI